MVSIQTVNDYDFGAIHYPFCKKNALNVVAGNKSIEEYRDYINHHKIKEATIIMPDLELLNSCPSLKHLKIVPSFDATDGFDFSPLYGLPEVLSLNCENQYGSRNQYISTIDYSQIKGLQELFVGVNKATLNYNKIDSLKTLRVGGFRGIHRDISDLFCSKELDTLELNGCLVESLNGIEKAPKMQCVYLYNNRNLKDISALNGIKDTLKALRIENCPKINDFSVLSDLDKLELLELSGSNTLSNLNFIDSMSELKTFVFNMNVLSGDLFPCLRLSYVFSEKNRKHYNYKNSDLPKGKYYRGNDTIEEWRRLE